MPHLVVLYTPNLESGTTHEPCDIGALCKALADTLCEQQDDQGRAVFPKGGVRVLAYPASHFAIADSQRDYAFMYLNLRLGAGRAAHIHQMVGKNLELTLHKFLACQLAVRPIGITLQIDEGHEVFDSKNSSIHPLFKN
jgi:5-carboxymethyl-2-hydroxymuconate isomerase